MVKKIYFLFPTEMYTEFCYSDPEWVFLLGLLHVSHYRHTKHLSARTEVIGCRTADLGSTVVPVPKDTDKVL